MEIVLNKTIEGVNPPKTLLGQEKLVKIAESAQKMFITKGFYDTSIRDICQEAGVAVGTFYIYFDDRLAVYRLLVKSYKREIKGILRDAIVQESTRRDKERVGIKTFVKYVYKNPHVYDIIWGSLSVDKKIFRDYYMSFAETYTKHLSDCDEVASFVDVPTLSYVLMGITNFMGLKAMFEGDYTEEMFDKLVDTYVMDIIEKNIFLK